jgi:hypothetical protein
MKRSWSALALLAALAAAGGARAQEMGGAGWRASRFDLGIYAGGSITSRWFESYTLTLDGTPAGQRNDDAQGYAPGFAPAFGAFAAFWATPSLGIRAHGSYTPMRLPFTGDGVFGEGAGERSRYLMNTWFYDLDLLFRPFAMREGAGMLRSMYLFAGGGGYTVNLAGENVAACEGTLASLGACVSFEPAQATVGQAAVGTGIDLVDVGPLALFAELGVHVYDSPAHVGDAWFGPITAPNGSTVRIADDATAVTGRLVLGLRMGFGDILPKAMPMAPPPLPPPPPPPPPPPAPPPVIDGLSSVNYCIVRDGVLTTVPIYYNPATGDSTADGRPVREAYPATAGYAASADWYINSAPVPFNGRRYVRYGLPRVLGTTEVISVGAYAGVALFAEPAAPPVPEVIYVPIRPGCEFQPYQLEVKASGVRG